MFRYLILISLFHIFAESRQKWHTSQISLNELFKLQKEHFDVFKDYLDLETQRLYELKNQLDSILYKWRNYTVTEQDKHIHINGLKIMIHTYQHLSRIEDLMNNKQSLEVLNIIDKDKIVNNDHVILAYQAMRRLQKFYEIPAYEMSSGTYNGRNIGDEMDACECYVMLKYSFEKYDMYGVSEWANQTYNKWIKDGQPSCVDINQLYFYSISSSMYTGFSFSSLFNANVNDHLKHTNNIAQFFSLMKNDMLECKTKDIIDRYSLIENGDKNSINLCKYGKSTRLLTKDLICQYNSKNSYYRILMPFKEEHISDDPHLKIYHDVLYDNEITKIKSIVMNTMTESTVVSQKSTATNEFDRSGQTAWLDKEVEAENFVSLNARIELITEFSTISAERFQIVNYGLGGHYLPHYDSFNKSDYTEYAKKTGNRLVTVLFYLNDVVNDGYTSFPNLNFIIAPEKGAAVVWYNLHLSNGNTNHNTLHGSCPILKGNKWIMTRWIRELGQNLSYSWKFEE